MGSFAEEGSARFEGADRDALRRLRHDGFACAQLWLIGRN
jgi:hypothetical protein